MSNYWKFLRLQFYRYLNEKWEYFLATIQLYWFRMAVLGIIGLLLWNKDLSFQLDLSAGQALALVSSENAPTTQSLLSFDFLPNILGSNEASNTRQKVDLAEKDNLSNTYSNMLFSEESNIFSTTATGKLKRQKQEAYIQRFAKAAQGEMDKFGIPASIKLAQGLIESNAGESPLSVKNNNHFGIKCFSKKCRKGHCSNFTDDSHKDFFRIYPTAWESYRAHSQMLQSKRYIPLQKLGKNYKSWAYGLQKAGYATDKNYAKKLIFLIESLGLDKYDR